jgi:multidrug resistance protein, MATE family
MLLQSRLMEVRSFLKESWSLGWPMILIMFFQFSMGVTDVYVAGYLGTDVLAAVGYVGQLYWTLVILANAITVGTVSMVSQAYGARSYQGIGSIAANAVIMGVGISTPLTVIALLSPSAIVRLAGMPTEIQAIGAAFVRIFALVLIPTYVMIISGGVLRASGRIRITLINNFVASSVNIVACLGLGLGLGPFPPMGYVGIAWATGIATTLGMALNLAHLFWGPGRLSLRCLVSPMTACLRNLVKLGVPTALQQIAWNAGTLVVYFLVGQLEGGQITALAAMTAGVRIEAIIFLPIFALNMAAAVLTGNRIGSGDIAGARSGGTVTAGLCLTIILLPACAIFILAPWLSSFLTDDPAVLAEMTRYLRINMLGMPFLAVGVTLSGALQGAGDTFATMRIIFTGMWLIRIPLILAVIHLFSGTATRIWWCMTGSIILMVVLLIRRFRGDAWTKASMDAKTKTLLWEACLSPSPGASDVRVCREEPDNRG